MSASAVNPARSIPRDSFWKRRVVAPIVAQLRQGISPEKIALTIALGTTLGVFPILGSTTVLCVFAAFWLKLNQPVIFLVHYVAYPLQLALLIPFYRAGETLFGKPHIPLSISFLIERFGSGPWQFVRDFGMIGLQGIVVWSLVAPVLATAVYYALRRPLRALASKAGGDQ